MPMTDLESTRARHPVAGEAGALLRRAGAPDELSAWAEGKPIDRAWDDCLRADWLVWLAAIDRLPLVAVVDGARAAVERVVELQSSGAEPLLAAISDGNIARLGHLYRLRVADAPPATVASPASPARVHSDRDHRSGAIRGSGSGNGRSRL